MLNRPSPSQCIKRKVFILIIQSLLIIKQPQLWAVIYSVDGINRKATRIIYMGRKNEMHISLSLTPCTGSNLLDYWSIAWVAACNTAFVLRYHPPLPHIPLTWTTHTTYLNHIYHLFASHIGTTYFHHTYHLFEPHIPLICITHTTYLHHIYHLYSSLIPLICITYSIISLCCITLYIPLICMCNCVYMQIYMCICYPHTTYNSWSGGTV